ncbi:DUF4348 domain-containing protein [Flavobacterium sp. FlaQc-50]|jgi:hypothetical protein|uniref:DUF4348 domain-containing protein n=1 Tax=unclassified Flavobacterium TaxID=196869 RepID=UPI003757132F
MRKTSILLITATLILSCKEFNKNTKALPKDKIVDVKEISNKNCISDFETFFKKFAKDSVYQKRMIAYPLKSQYYGEDSYEELKTELIRNESEFRYINFADDSKAMNSKTGKFTIKKKTTKNKVIYTRFGYDNGIYISYEFNLINGCWYLVKIKDESS